MNKISLLQFILQGIGTVTVYYLMIRFFNWFMDTLNDFKERYARRKNDFIDRLRVYSFLRKEREKDIQKAIQRMKYEELKQEKILQEYANNLSNDEDINDDTENYEPF